MDYSKINRSSGKWAPKKELYEKGVTTAKIVSETKPEESSYKDEDGKTKMQDVCKVRFPGFDDDYNVALNWISMKALTEVYGTDSKDWQGHSLGCTIEKQKMGTDIRYAMYLYPEGYEVAEIEVDGKERTVIRPKSSGEAMGAFRSKRDELEGVPPADAAA